MKKIFTLCAALFMGMAAFAQVDNTFQFVDADGNEIADGSTWHAFEKTVEPVMTQIHSGLYVKNTTGEDAYAAVDYEFVEAAGGSFMVCYPATCITTKFNGTTVPTGVKTNGPDLHLANTTEDMEIEWVVKEMFTEEVKGTCTVTLQLKRMAGMEPDSEVLAYGPKITLVLHNDGTTQGIGGVGSAADKTPVAYYSLDGRRLPVAQKGLNIVKYSDGTTAKVVVE